MADMEYVDYSGYTLAELIAMMRTKLPWTGKHARSAIAEALEQATDYANTKKDDWEAAWNTWFEGFKVTVLDKVEDDAKKQFEAWLTAFQTQVGAEYTTWLSSFKTTKTTEFNTWFASIKGLLSGDVATNLANQINEVKATAKVNEYGLFVDNRATAPTGYWHKMFEIKTSGYTNTDINVVLSVQQLYNAGSTSAHLDNGILKVAILQGTNGAPNTTYSYVKWLIASHGIGDNLKKFAVNVIPDSTGNRVEFYIYNNIQWAGYKVNVIDLSSRTYAHTLTFTGCVDDTTATAALPAATMTTLPTTGTIIYSTPGEYMVPKTDFSALQTSVAANTAAIAAIPAIPAIETGTLAVTSGIATSSFTNNSKYTKEGKYVEADIDVTLTPSTTVELFYLVGLPVPKREIRGLTCNISLSDSSGNFMGALPKTVTLFQSGYLHFYIWSIENTSCLLPYFYAGLSYRITAHIGYYTTD